MEDVAEPRRTRGWMLKDMAREDLDLFGQEELRERIETLKAEIARVERQLERNSSGRAAADALFSFKGD